MSTKKTKVAGVSPYGHSIQGFFPFSSIFSHRINVLENDGIFGADALILWGGTDIHPSLYGQKAHPQNQVVREVGPTRRDEIEWWLLHQAFVNKIPIIGVCRGAQMLCAFAGGSLYQHVTNHNGAHDIDAVGNLKFLDVKADHHQMMDLTGTTHELLAWSSTNRASMYEKETVEKEGTTKGPEKEPEVVYFPTIKGFAIQPHPEWEQDSAAFNKWVNDMIVDKLFSTK